MKNYFNKLREILKGQSILYFLLLTISALFTFKIALSALFSHNNKVAVDWVMMCLIALFVLSLILQSLLLQKRCYPLYVFRVLIVILFAFQLTGMIYNNTIREQYRDFGESYCEENDLFRFRLKKNLHNAWYGQTYRNDTLFKICFSIDSLSCRIPDDEFMEEYLKNSNHPDKHALFLGCSFTFGNGLTYSSTFPYLFEELNSDYKSYNYGIPGCGPSQIALLFDHRANVIKKESIKESDGFALYTYIDDHLNRVYGGSNFFRWSHSTLPPNIYVENDSLVLKKWSKAYLLYVNGLNRIALLRLFDIEINYPKTESFYKRFASIINYTAKKYWKLKPGNHFYVSVYPGYGMDLKWTQYLDEKIVVLLVEPPSDYDDKIKYQVHPPYEFHPSKALNLYYVEELTRLINEYELQIKD